MPKRKGPSKDKAPKAKRAMTSSAEEDTEDSDVCPENLRPARSTTAVDEDDWSASATRILWECDYKGNAPDVLLSTISVYLAQRDIYACGLVNSSGTGKSRMVDELAKRIITVPMCLRRRGSNGFPPPDEELRDWLLPSRSGGKEAIAEALRRFIYALLDVTLDRLKKIQSKQKLDGLRANVIERQERLAWTFRRRMTENQKFNDVNGYRYKFFQDVIAKADTLAENKVKVLGRNENDKKSGNTSTDNNTRYVYDAGMALVSFVDQNRALIGNKEMKRPLIILAFDESHGLTDFARGQNWSVFVELHRVLNALVSLPIFSLFISTAGKFHLLPPEKRRDLSFWDEEDKKRLLPAITETGFDQLAIPAIEGVVTLGEVVTDAWMCHLGRPLFGSRYDCSQSYSPIRREILYFARLKLFCGFPELERNLDQTLACLSVRFPLEFNSADPFARTLLEEQVERHLRLCTTATSGFELLYTTVGSEPLLAQAAADVMYATRKSSIRHLSGAMYKSNNCIDPGQRGELVAALLIMQARDAVATATGMRWIGVNEFLETLLGGSARENLHEASPSHLRPQDKDLPLTKTFEDARMWFNHVLKVRNADLINVQYLWRFITRGAMILCDNNERGVDMVLPVCYSGDVLSRDTVTAILIQIKNDSHFRDTIHELSFEEMDPFHMTVFDEGSTPRPVIRMVFALASDRSITEFSPPRRSTALRTGTYKPRSANFTSYDIWCAGLHSETFAVVGDDGPQYQKVLDRTVHPGHYNIENAYNGMYPTGLMDQKLDLIRHFEPLLEMGGEHQRKYKDGTTGAPAV